MIYPLLNWLNKPYYFNTSLLFKLKISLFFGLFIFLFLYVFEPFELYNVSEVVLGYALVVGYCTALGMFVLLYVPPLVFKNYFKEEYWTIGRNLFLILIGFLFIGNLVWYFGNIYKKKYRVVDDIDIYLFHYYTFTIGIIPVLGYLFFNEKNITQKRVNKSKEINKLKKSVVKKSRNEEKIVIYSDNKKEFLEIKIDNLVYINSQGNYASFFILDENHILKEKVLRITLAKIDQKLEDYIDIFRCHKSFIVNTKFIESIDGNARGYFLNSSIIPQQIPVSRNFKKEVLLNLIK